MHNALLDAKAFAYRFAAASHLDVNNILGMDLLRPLLANRPQFSGSTMLDILSAVLYGYAGRPLDFLYSRLGGFSGRFFPAGWGDLSIVNLKEDLELIKQWPPQGMKIEWRLLQQGAWEGVPYKLYEGSFRTPCVQRVYDALPLESRTGRVQLLCPMGPSSPAATAMRSGVQTINVPKTSSFNSGADFHAVAAAANSETHLHSVQVSGRHLFADGSSSSSSTASSVLHLAATGDQGFGRRLRLGGPLLQQGICQLVHESPYYGARRPPQQKGSKLCAVSDLLALGWATIYKSLCLLHWLEAEGIEQRGISGLSMGGVHASMTAGLYPHPLAVTPLLTPRSAAVAYCDGALAPLMSWGALLSDRDLKDNEVEQVVAVMSQPVSLLQQAKYVRLQHMQQQQQQQQQSDMQQQQLNALPASLAPQQQVSSGWQQQCQAKQLAEALKQPLHQQQSAQCHWLQQQRLHSELQQAQFKQQQLQQQAIAKHEAVAAMQQMAALAAATQAAAEEQATADQQWASCMDTAQGEQYQVCLQPPGQQHCRLDSSKQMEHLPQQHARQQQQLQHKQNQQLQQQHWQGNTKISVQAREGQVRQADANTRSDSHDWRRQIWRWPNSSSAIGAARSLAAAAAVTANSTAKLVSGVPDDHHTFRRLRHVLETYTDVTRYPRPVRPDAAILVAARDDGYVDIESVKALQAHWPGSELRLVSGGHVSAFLMHQDAFRQAISDSLSRLATPLPSFHKYRC